MHLLKWKKEKQNDDTKFFLPLYQRRCVISKNLIFVCLKILYYFNDVFVNMKIEN